MVYIRNSLLFLKVENLEICASNWDLNVGHQLMTYWYSAQIPMVQWRIQIKGLFLNEHNENGLKENRMANGH